MDTNIIEEQLYKIIIEKENIKNNINSIIKNIENKEKELDNLTENIANHKIAYETLNNIINKNTETYINSIKTLLNKAISTIFYDENYIINIDYQDKKINFILIDKNQLDNENNPLEIDIDDACGGGIITVIGFILQLFIIESLELNKIIFIDEGFMALSEKYRPLLYEFTNEFSKTSGLKVLLISHDELVKEYANTLYEIEHGEIKNG